MMVDEQLHSGVAFGDPLCKHLAHQPKGAGEWESFGPYCAPTHRWR